MEIIWHDGVDNYKENRLIIDSDTGLKKHHLILHDVPTQDLPYIQLAEKILKGKGKVDVLLSGGQDSELLLRTIIVLGIDFKVTTMKLVIDGCLVNTHDLYYSEHLCGSLGIKQNFITLDVRQFFENNLHIPYLEPYLINEPHVATHFWMLDRTDNYPIFAGDYSWPWANENIISPHRYQYCAYKRYLQDTKRDGIVSFLNHSLELNMAMVKKHRESYNNNIDTGSFKSQLYSSLGVGEFTPRLRSSGWEGVKSKVFNKNQYHMNLIKSVGITPSTIFWGSKINSILKGNITQNDKY